MFPKSIHGGESAAHGQNERWLDVRLGDTSMCDLRYKVSDRDIIAKVVIISLPL